MKNKSRWALAGALVGLGILALPHTTMCGVQGYPCASAPDPSGYYHLYYEVEPLGITLLESVLRRNLDVFYRSGYESRFAGVRPPGPPAEPAVKSEDAGPDAGSETWSAPVNGLRGRLVLTGLRDPGSQAQVSIAVEFENVGPEVRTFPLPTGSAGSVLRFGLEEESGQPAPELHPAGNEITGLPTLTPLAPGARKRLDISRRAVEYVPSGRVMLRPVSLQAWTLSAGQKLFLRATFHPLPLPDAPGPLWTGTLELPRVELPWRE